jgi:hypothetical protein
MYISYKSDFISFVKSKLMRFVIPFLFWVMFYFLLYLTVRILKVSLQAFISVNEVKPVLVDIQILKNLCVVPFVANWSALKNAGVYIDLWFLPAVFSITILHRLLCYGKVRYRTVINLLVTTLLSYLVVFLNNRYGFHNSVPWSIDVALVCLPFLIISQCYSYAHRVHWIDIPFFILAI